MVTVGNLLGLEGKNALVVGGGFGMGRESVLLLARAGANVVVGDMLADRAAAVAAEAEALGVRAGTTGGDVTKRVEAEALVDRAADFYDGRLDVLVNIVGIASWALLMDLDDATWEHDLAINLSQHLYVGRAAARRMIAAGIAGRIAMVASVDGFYGSPNHAAYGAAKAGVVSLTKTMAQEWGKHGIRVNAIAPDAILTPRVRVIMEQAGHDPDDTSGQAERPLQRSGTPAEIAGPLIFMVSDLSSYVSGQTLMVDGGMFGVPGGHRT